MRIAALLALLFLAGCGKADTAGQLPEDGQQQYDLERMPK